MAKFQHIKEILVRNFEHLINLASGEVARQFGVHVNDLRGNRRIRDVAYANNFNAVERFTDDLINVATDSYRLGVEERKSRDYFIESIFKAIKDGRGRVLALNNEDYFNPVFVPAALWITARKPVDVLPRRRPIPYSGLHRVTRPHKANAAGYLGGCRRRSDT